MTASKTITMFLAAAAFLMTSGCDKENNKDNNGFDAIFELEKVKGVSVTDMGEGLNRIDMTLSNKVYVLQLAFCTAEAELPATPFTFGKALGKDGFTATLKAYESEMPLGADTKIGITKDDSGEYELCLTSTVEGKRIKGHFKGSIRFAVEIEIGDPSGKVVMISEGDAVGEDGNAKSGVSKYAIRIYDSEGKEIGAFDAVNKPGLKLKNLVGEYFIKSYPTDVWTMDNGWLYPQYGIAGGSYFLDDKGIAQYITKGDVTISEARDRDGGMLYCFSGEDLETATMQGSNAKNVAFSEKFVRFLEGGDLRTDQIIHSDVMGIDMLYTVYLPNSWDGTKEFPVIYLLHGAESAPGNNKWHTDGNFAGQLAMANALGRAPEAIVLTPNCTVDGNNLFYCNGDLEYMTFFFEEFMPQMESMYCVRQERGSRIVAGLSMGGYGSLYYGSLHPELFCHIYACSPATFGGPSIYDLFSNDLKDGKTIPGITIEIGTEDFLFESADAFEKFLTSLGIEHDYITRPGAHDWPFWTACGDKIIKKAAELFK